MDNGSVQVSLRKLLKKRQPHSFGRRQCKPHKGGADPAGGQAERPAAALLKMFEAQPDTNTDSRPEPGLSPKRLKPLLHSRASPWEQRQAAMRGSDTGAAGLERVSIGANGLDGRTPEEDSRAECPVCGEDFPKRELERHVEAELQELDRLEREGAWSNNPHSAATVQGVVLHKKPWQVSAAPAAQTRKVKTRSWTYSNPAGGLKKLLVLGENAKDGTIHPGRKQRPTPKAIPFFNHYADGGGFWDGDTLGLEGAASTTDNTRWEGCGSTSLGPCLGAQ